MRILVVATNTERDPLPVYPIGASMVAGALARAGHEVRGLDLAFEEDPAAAVRAAVREFAPRVVAMSVRAVDNTTSLVPRYYLPEIAGYVDAVRDESDATVLVGGAGYSLFPREILDLLAADYGLQGEGDVAAVRFAATLARGEALEPGDGLWVRRADGSIAGGPARGMLAPRDWSRPSYEHFPLVAHDAAGGTGSVQSKRGCCERCTYCTYPLLEGRVFRVRPPEDVADDVAEIAAAGARYTYFVDNNFNLPADHAMDVCRAIAARGLKMSFTAFVTPWNFREELAPAMAAAGMRSVEVGSEAGTPITLAAMGKSHDVDDILRIDRACSEVAIAPAHFFIFGGPDETWDTIDRSLETIGRLQGPAVAVVGIRVFPGTELHRRAIAEGQVAADNPLLAPFYYRNPALDGDAVFERLKEFAKTRPNFFVSGTMVNGNADFMTGLRRRGRRGPLWEYYNLAR